MDKYIDHTQRYAINPLYRMRRDLSRVYIFPINPFTCPEMNSRIFISPVEAIILSLFNGERKISEVADELAYLLDCEKPKAIEITVKCLTRCGEMVVEVTDENQDDIIQYRPDEFVIPKGEIDLAADLPKIPEVIMFIPTFSCGLDCVYCYAPRDKNEVVMMDFKIVEMFLDKMRGWMMPALFLSGGEPFNYPYIKDLIVACQKRRIKPIIPTKCPLSGEMIDYIKDHEIDEMQFSIDTLDGEISRKLIGRDRTYLAALVSAIGATVRKGIEVYTNTVVTDYNIHSLPKLIECMADLGVKQMIFSQYARSLYRHIDTLFCKPDDLKAFGNWLKDHKVRYPSIKFNFKHIKDHTAMDGMEKRGFFREIPFCTAGKMGMVILPDGLVTICENMYYQRDLLIGDLKTQSLEEVWFSRRRIEIIDRGDSILAAGACLTCAGAVDCYRKKGKCFVRALQAFGDIKMPDPYCPESIGGARIL